MYFKTEGCNPRGPKWAERHASSRLLRRARDVAILDERHEYHGPNGISNHSGFVCGMELDRQQSRDTALASCFEQKIGSWTDPALNESTHVVNRDIPRSAPFRRSFMRVAMDGEIGTVTIEHVPKP